MAYTVTNTTAVKTAKLAVYGTSAGTNALIRLYDGAVPANADATATGNMLAELVVTGSLIATNTGLALVLNPIAETVGTAICTAVGKTATYARLLTAAGVTLQQIEVGTAGCSLILTDTLIKENVAVRITGYTINSGN